MVVAVVVVGGVCFVGGVGVIGSGSDGRGRRGRYLRQYLAATENAITIAAATQQ